MIKEGNETVTNCNTFEFKVKDGKMRNADVVIESKLKGILDRNKLTDVQKENEIKVIVELLYTFYIKLLLTL